ncbi:MAG: hypothetical protein COV76_00720 [Candidatus Omnitrophica bacterium CG11_big_fil_rev_8_21_14_0_20_64_10]|nr:MAG: hypothetical protein COV76_00720 [Candidatus Omnitrophica bacterium CG11_big_fil_rev_8_21_14_0_20_64_10]
MRKAFFLFCLLCSVFFAGPAPRAAAAEGTVLEFWELAVGEELMRSLLDRFERQNPGIQVRFQQLSYDFGLEKIITAIAAGNPPDVIQLGTDQVPQFSSTGVLQDLTDDLAPIRDRYLMWDTVTYQGRIYGMPWLAGTRILFYNRDLFVRAGLHPDRPPATWEELKKAAEKIDRLGPDIKGFGIHVGEPYSPWQEFLPFAWGNGAEVLDSTWERSRLTEPAMVEALTFYRSLKPFSLIERQSQVNQNFTEGKLGMQISGAWNFRGIPRANPTLNYGVGLCPKPSASHGTPAAFAGGEVLVVSRLSKHREAALKLIRFLADQEQTMTIVEAQRNVTPTVESAVQNPYYQSRPKERLFFEQVRWAVPPPAHPEWGKIQERLTRMVEEVIFNDMEPAAALAQAAGRVDEILQAREHHGRFSDTIFFTGLGAACAVGWGIWAFLKRRRNGKRVKLPRRDVATASVFISPFVITFLVFQMIPLLHSLFLSFSRYNLLSSEISFVGFSNFWEVLSDVDFRNALWHTLIFALGTIPFTMVLALFAAVLINTKVPFKQLYQAGMFLPVATSVIVIATIFTYLYAPGGVTNRMLEFFHLPVPEPSWLLNKQLALPAIMVMSVWASFGYYMVLFLAGLQTIPIELYEAASIDGANEWQKFRYITLPQLKPILLLAVVINTIRTLQVFPEIFTMTQGGPLGATTTVVWYLYEAGFKHFEMGRAAAVGYLLFLITMILSWLQTKLFKVEEGS